MSFNDKCQLMAQHFLNAIYTPWYMLLIYFLIGFVISGWFFYPRKKNE